jgi:hypothetical protein
VEIIIDELCDISKRALKSCCLVHRSWIPRSRLHLFQTVTLIGDRDLRAWSRCFVSDVTFGRMSVAGYVKKLEIHVPPDSSPLTYEPEYLQNYMDHFSRFNNVEFLVINGINLLHFEAHDLQACFAHFAPSLRCLHLDWAETASSLIPYFQLLAIFPNLESLSIDGFSRWGDEEQVATSDIVCPFRGYLKLLNSKDPNNTFVNHLNKVTNGPHFHTVVLDLGNSVPKWLPMYGLFSACGSALQDVDLSFDLG